MITGVLLKISGCFLYAPHRSANKDILIFHQKVLIVSEFFRQQGLAILILLAVEMKHLLIFLRMAVSPSCFVLSTDHQKFYDFMVKVIPFYRVIQNGMI